MINTLRTLVIAGLLLPLTLPLQAATNSGLSHKVQQSLKANKISTQSLSVVTLPLTGPGNSTFFNADVSINPASTMKLVTTSQLV
jgi:D-alanyl-D-alanine carboxypeptidase/D-alanyl-D-alanine-endopeptidase (penicillin-binding protein 4)